MLGWLRFCFFLASVLGVTCLVQQRGDAQDPFQTQVRPTDPLSGAEQLETFQLPDGFEIELFASDPDILKPMNIAFDARGRVWISESQEYPFAVEPGEFARDHIKILEDEDGDGRAEKITVFADNMNIPIGLYPFRNGCIVFSIPNIWWLEDTDGDNVADRREILYGPMGYERDTHGLNNAFRRGFDGWLYACHGFNNQTSVAGKDGHRIEMQSGNTYRMRLDGGRIEQFTWGQVNPFGMTIDSRGNLFTADCHSKPIYQLIRGGYYPSFGKPHDGLGFVEPMMDHLHGSTAIAGLAYYADRRFPQEYQGNFFSGNVMTSRVNRNRIELQGATRRAIEEPDFLRCSDPWFRPVDVRMGPDGALYIADFYNRIIGHYEVDLNHPGRDRVSGRIWRIEYRGKESELEPRTLASCSLAGMSLAELFEALGDSNLTYQKLALDYLCDVRAPLELEQVQRLAWEQLLEHAALSGEADGLAAGQRSRQANCLWVLSRTGANLDELVTTVLDSTDEHVVIHAMRLLAEQENITSEQRASLVGRALEGSAEIRAVAFDALGRHPRADQIKTLVASATSNADPHLDYIMRRAIHSHLLIDGAFDEVGKSEFNAEQIELLAEVTLAVHSEQASRFLLDQLIAERLGELAVLEVVRHIARYPSVEQVDELIDLARQRFSGDVAVQIELIRSIQQSLRAAGVEQADSLETWEADLSKMLIETAERFVGQWENYPLAGKTRQDNPWIVERRRASDGDLESLYFGSLPTGEQATGRLRSKSFVVPSQLSFYCAGHIGHPDQPVVAQNRIRLIDAETGAVLIESLPPRNDVAQKIEWQLAEWEGRQARIEIVDGDQRNAFAWLAVGRFSPPVVSVLPVSPRDLEQQLLAAMEMTPQNGRGTLPRLVMEKLNQSLLSPVLRHSFARAIAEQTGDRVAVAMAAGLLDFSLSESQQQSMGHAIAEQAPEAVEEWFAEEWKGLPSSAHARIINGLIGSEAGRARLNRLLDEDQLDVSLFQSESMMSALRVTAEPSLVEAIETRLNRLPSRSDAVRQLIADRLAALSDESGDSAKGAESFKQRCANCHRIGREGAEIGPQLDGIGNRGLSRLLEDLLDPNRNVDTAFRTTTILTIDGQVLTGLERRSEGETLVFADAEGKEFRLQGDEIDELSQSNLSLMPTDLAAQIPEAEFADLIQFLLNQRVASGDE